jgi:hypothetical protein
MSGSGAIQGEMPGFPFPGRPGGEHDEPLLDMIIDRRALPPDAPLEMHDLARMLAALAGPGEPGELAGEVAARAAFVQLTSPAGISPAPRRPVRHRRPRRLASSRTGVAVALAAAAASIGVLAAYANVLPGPVQKLAHTAVAAPAPHQASTRLSPAGKQSLAGTGAPAVRSQPSSSPEHVARTTAPARQRGAQAQDQPTPAVAQPSSRDGTAPSCSLNQGTAKPGTAASAPAGSPYWWQSVHCAAPVSTATRPAAQQPTLAPYMPRS